RTRCRRGRTRAPWCRRCSATLIPPTASSCGARPRRASGTCRRATMPGVYDGLTVLDLSWGTAGPMTTMFLADHGAAVTRIEPPVADPFAARSGYRVWNRGKRSARLDLRSDAGRGAFLALA